MTLRYKKSITPISPKTEHYDFYLYIEYVTIELFISNLFIELNDALLFPKQSQLL